MKFECWSKLLNAHKVSVQMTSLEQVLIICMIGMYVEE